MAVVARWNGAEIARSEGTVVVEGNHYFPPGDVNFDRLAHSDHTSQCAWKGTAHYHHVVVDGERNDNAAWYYPAPKPAAAGIRDRIAFWHGVDVGED